MKKVTFLSLWFLLFAGILTGAAQTQTLPLTVIVPGTDGSVHLQSAVPVEVVGNVTAKGFEHRLKGAGTWTVVLATDAFEADITNLPTGTYQVRAFIEVSDQGMLYSRTNQVMVVCDCNIPAPDPCELVNCSPIPAANGRLTTFTNVMYDFQHQQLEAYVTSSGQPTQYEWFVKKQGASDDSLEPIAGAPNAAFFTVPADFMYQYGDLVKSNTTQTPDGSNSAVELTIRCVMSNPNTATPVVANLDILFIRTNTAGYSTINGVRSLTINRGGSPNGGDINVALLNLGQSEGNNAGDLGDFYQWGRIADGHQHIVWSKNPSTRENIITPMSGNGATSAVIARDVAAQAIDSQGQVTGVDYVGNFITNIGDWGTSASGNSDLWGNTSNTRSGAPISLDGAAPTWTTRAQANNVCPQGWRVPSRFELWDMYRGDGADDPVNVSSGAYDETNAANKNTWRWRGVQTNTNAIGGVIITNDSGENLCLPAAGIRDNSGGTLYFAGTGGGYWSSTFYFTSFAYFLDFISGYVNAGNLNTSRAYGLSVRCVAE